MWLLLIFLALPIVEIALFIEIGGLIGLFPTLALVLLAALAGSAVVRRQGMQALTRLRASVEAGDDPAGPIVHAALVLVAGVLLILPGFFTDALGLLLLVPPLRAALIRWGAARTTVRATTFVRTRPRTAPRPAETIDADYEVVEEAPRPRPGRSGWTRQH